MSSNNTSSRGGGLGIAGVLTVVFVVLKLVGVQPIASWSWIWVLSPLWISLLLGLVVLAIFGIIYFAARAHSERDFTRLVVRKSQQRRGGYRGLPNNEKALGGYRYGDGPRS